MKDAVKHRIQNIKSLSAVPHNGATVVSARFADVSEDNLLKSIRNKREADIFQSELRGVIKLSKNK